MFPSFACALGSSVCSFILLDNGTAVSFYYISPPGGTRPLLLFFVLFCFVFFCFFLLLSLCLLCREGGFREWCGGGRRVTASVLVARVGEKDVPARQRRFNLPIMLLVPQNAAGASKELCGASVSRPFLALLVVVSVYFCWIILLCFLLHLRGSHDPCYLEV